MKKLLNKILTVFITIILAMSTLGGCGLITTDTEKDMQLVVAEVKVDDITDSIYKKEMISAYNSYGYYYVNYYGYSLEEAYELILDNLINNKIVLFQSVKALTGATNLPGNEKGYFEQASLVADSDRTSEEKILTAGNFEGKAYTEFSNAKKIISNKQYKNLLSEYEVAYAKYSVLSSVYSLIESFKDEDETTYNYEKVAYTARTTLTEKTEEDGNEWEIRYDAEKSKITNNYLKDCKTVDKKYNLGIDFTEYEGSTTKTKYDLSLAIYKAFDEMFTNYLQDKEVKADFNRAIKSLKKLGLIKESESSTPRNSDDVLKISYFNDSLQNEYQSAVVQKYKLALESQQKKNFSDDVLYQEYTNLFNTQGAEFDSNVSSYENKLGQISEDSFIVYNPQEGYGYVSNLLIGFDSKQSSLLSNKQAEKNITQSEINDYRNTLLQNLYAKDLRESWVLSNFGTYNESDNSFTFDEKYCLTEELRKFNGSLYGATSYTYLNEDEEETTGWTYKDIYSTKETFKSFYDRVLGDIMGFNKNFVLSNNLLDSNITDLELGSNLLANGSKQVSEEVLKKFRDIIFAYSTDSGSLQENFGYVYSPVTSKTTYVKEFADAAKNIVGKGAGAYTVVATDYGYHIILCTYSLGKTDAKLSKADFLDQLTNSDAEAFAKLFKKHKIELVVSNQVEKISSSFLTEFTEKAVKYQDRYDSLFNA